MPKWKIAYTGDMPETLEIEADEIDETRGQIVFRTGDRITGFIPVTGDLRSCIKSSD